MQKTDSSIQTQGPVDNTSFVMNVFRGHLDPRQVFPFPHPLNEEQRETLKLLVNPVTKFFEVRED